MKLEKKIALDILVEGSGGDLVFVPVKESRSDLRKLVKESKNPVIKHNVFRLDSKKKVAL